MLYDFQPGIDLHVHCNAKYTKDIIYVLWHINSCGVFSAKSYMKQKLVNISHKFSKNALNPWQIPYILIQISATNSVTKIWNGTRLTGKNDGIFQIFRFIFKIENNSEDSRTHINIALVMLLDPPPKTKQNKTKQPPTPTFKISRIFNYK